MTLWKRLLIHTVIMSLLSPVALWAADEEVTPTFQNAAQAERAANLATASFTEEDMEQARQQAAVQAESQIEQLADGYADGVVEQISNDYADKVVDETARTRAEESIKEKARQYALSVADGDPAKYREIYDEALARAKDPSFHNALDTAYESELEKLKNPDDPDFDGSVWQGAYDYAKERATGDGYKNARQTAYEYAYNRATDPDFPNAYQTEYKKSLEAEVAEITGQKIQDIHEMRYVEKLGWGVIASQKIHLHPSNNGRGNKWKHNMPPSVEDETIPPGPGFDEIPLEQEIAEATRRNVRTGWVEDPVQTMGSGKKGNKKQYGLTQTSGLGSEVAAGNSKENRGNGKNKSSNGNSGKKDSTSNTQMSSGSYSKNNSGKNNSSFSNKSDKSNGKSNKGGNSNGNKGGNGKNK